MLLSFVIICFLCFVVVDHRKTPVAPVSVFDERPAEDPTVNRLEDSIVLWKAICSAKLLAKAKLILFLNKCDLLKRKLKRGVQFNKYLHDYGSRPNEVMAVVKCAVLDLLVAWMLTLGGNRSAGEIRGTGETVFSTST